MEAARREVNACTDIEKLKCLTLNLMLQVEALRDMTKELLLRVR